MLLLLLLFVCLFAFLFKISGTLMALAGILETLDDVRPEIDALLVRAIKIFKRMEGGLGTKSFLFSKISYFNFMIPFIA